MVQKVDNAQRLLTKGSANLCSKFKSQSQFKAQIFRLVRSGFQGVKGKLCPIKVSGISMKLWITFWCVLRSAKDMAHFQMDYCWLASRSHNLHQPGIWGIYWKIWILTVLGPTIMHSFPIGFSLNFFFFFFKEVRNATEAHTALMRGSPYVPRTLQMQLMRINICRVLRRWNQ